MKKCTRCNKEKSIEDFMIIKNKVTKQCKICIEKYRKITEKYREKLRELSTKVGIDEKFCFGCNRKLELKEFADRVGGKKCAKCKKCNLKQLNYLKIHKCPHGKMNKSACKDCDGVSICEHKKNRTYCSECNGGSLCEHKMRKDRCYDCKNIYGRYQYCEHEKIKTICRDCKGGSLCEHNKRRTRCKICEGGSICEHKKHKNNCRYCDFAGYISKIISTRVRQSLKTFKDNRSIEYLGCDIETYKKYLESKFIDSMSWDNYGNVWQIDHIVPLKYNNPTIKEVKERLHYLNTQPLWTEIYILKGNRYIYRLAATDGCLTENVGKTVIPSSLNESLLSISKKIDLGDTPH